MSNKPKKRTGVYPGTFDPVTKGHLDLIRRSSGLVDHLVIGVAENAGKKPLFTMEERHEMVKTDIENMADKGCEIEVISFSHLLSKFAREVNASCIFRGLRAVSDFEYEFQLSRMHTKMDPDMEMVYLMASDEWQFVSASMVKEVASLGGDVGAFVTPQVAEKLQKKFKK